MHPPTLVPARRTALVVNHSNSELMVTALIRVLDQEQRLLPCRTLIDTCSTTNFITERLANALRLRKGICSVPIDGINAMSTISKYAVNVTIRSRDNRYERTLTFLTVPQISQLVPNQPIDRAALKIPSNLMLADPNFHKPAAVDMLLGAGVTLSLLCVGQIKLSVNQGEDLYLQKTRVGWVIGGSAPTMQPTRSHRCQVTSLQFDMTKFWEIEESYPEQHLSMGEEQAESHYQQTVSRNTDGRYIVALPFNDKLNQLGESRSRAYNRLISIERKLAKNPELKNAYEDNIAEYLTLRHMSEVPADRLTDKGYYLPHHAVLKEGSLTTRLRVVFDGSAETSTGISLNQTLLVGPTIQPDIVSLLLRFRIHCYVLTADIEKMFRQFLIRPEDRKYQRILWRNSEGELTTFELNTVTFGMACSPYLATRSLHQLAQDEGHSRPQAARVLLEDTYVDDILTGAATKEEAIAVRDELINLLKSAHLNIRQWASNDPELLIGLSQEKINLQLQLGDSSTLKTLGVFWNSAEDSIVYTVNLPGEVPRPTKRTILSQIAKIFDPLGLLGPVICHAKIFMQRLWGLKLDWDESLPSSHHTEWTNFYNQLQQLNHISFKRRTVAPDAQHVELHGFCDASERAYGACIYVRTIDQDGHIYTELLCAKSRVAPLKTVTIPRLELCGALLLSRLYTTVVKAIRIKIKHSFFWTDSTVVLHWLQTAPSQLKQFVANRVAEIQSTTDESTWRHVRSFDNPADALSRGQLPAEFTQPSLWPHGPEWLQRGEENWPVTMLTTQTEEIPERKGATCLHTVKPDCSLLNKYSSIRKLEAVIAYCLRFTRNNRNKGPLSASEIFNARHRAIQLAQKSAFTAEIQALATNKSLSNSSRLNQLNPFIDEQGLMRVGGRIQHSHLPRSQRHPIILPKSENVTRLLVEEEHRRHLHAGVQATLYALRRRYWPIDGRNQVRKVIRSCVTCCKLKPPSLEYVMGELPADRVTPARPFSKVGLDYCGPFYVKEKKHRNRNRIKIYVAIFVCFTVKAVHLEVVSDLTTEAFLVAFRRFIARKGMCTDVYSDNGKNFVGANNELKELQTMWTDQQHTQTISAYSAHQGIRWHFIPARAPNFGGLWKAAVKSFKHNLRRVVGASLFTYEEFNTFAVEIKAVLNFRPLTTLSSDPNDLLTLTPAHFLIGDTLTSLPEQDFRDIAENRLSSWQHIQRVRQHFWVRWHRKYINELTVRHKWTKGQPEIREGSIVLLKEDNVPPLQWVMGRVAKLHPGPDEIIRVVTVQTARSTFDRSVKKVAPLPVQLPEEEPNQ